MNQWQIKQWPKSYPNTSLIHPIYLVDSHQLDGAGKLTRRYNSIIPCEALARANDVTDQICTWLVDTKCGPNNILPYLENCPNIRYPPPTLRFTFTHLGRILNGENSKRIEKLVENML